MSPRQQPAGPPVGDPPRDRRGGRPDDQRDDRVDGRPDDQPDDQPGDPSGERHQAQREVGVGPWPGPWPRDGSYDPELLAGGDRRNVVDRYRYLRVAAVRADLATRRHPVHVAVENFQHDLNIGSVVRTANAVNAAGVHVVGRRRWNRRGAMVTDAYLDVHHHVDASALSAWALERDLPLLALDTGPGAVPLETYDMPRRCVLVLGQEGPGLTPAARAAADAVLEISQFGSTRSLNAGAAAAIALHAWVRRHVFGQQVG